MPQQNRVHSSKTSVGSGYVGFSSVHNRSVTQLTDCSSDQDLLGCMAWARGQLMATRMEVSKAAPF